MTLPESGGGAIEYSPPLTPLVRMPTGAEMAAVARPEDFVK